MEKYYTIPTSDGAEIRWILNSKEKLDKLIIFVHGFTGSMWEAHYYSGKWYFTERGYDVFRFNLYTDGDTTRKLRDCSVKTHSEDIKTVNEYFSEYREIYLVGHSLAGPCFSWVDEYPENINKIIFWDPAFEVKTTGLKFYEESWKIYYQASGKHLEIWKEMYEEFLEDNFLEQLEKQNFSKSNMFAIYADGDRHVGNKTKTDEIWIESHIIQGANHGFTQEWKFDELFDKTLEYIEK
jgi:esterase/lipase